MRPACFLKPTAPTTATLNHMAPDAGWYDDGTGRQRWWDGVRWTEEFIDLRDESVELRTGEVPTGPATVAAGWYDDQRGRLRWWDGKRWTNAIRYSGEEQEFADIVVDGRWIHFGDGLSQPVGGVSASVVLGSKLVARSKFARATADRIVHGASGVLAPRLLKRAILPATSYLVIDAPEQVWVAAVPAGKDAEADRFVTWVNTVSRHYLYG